LSFHQSLLTGSTLRIDGRPTVPRTPIPGRALRARRSSRDCWLRLC